MNNIILVLIVKFMYIIYIHITPHMNTQKKNQ